MRFAMFDIECTQLEATFGRLICVCFKFTDEDKVRTVRIPRYRNEKTALEKIVKIYNRADVVLSWNGKLFDIKFLNSRLLHHGMPPVDPKMHVDLMWTCRSNLRFRGSRLEGVSEDLRTKTNKFKVPGWRWVLAAEGDKESIDMIVKHCEYDVILTEEMFHLLKPFIKRITK